jgi:hypothetical protein
VQVPVVPARPHERQAPVQAVRQQMPCSQNPLWHSAVVVQAAPFGRLPQLPPLQTLGATQFASVVQLTRQLPFVPQLYAPQVPAVTVPQTPAPSHVRAGVKLVPVQVDAAQVVPFA